jgi:hypothetical protein
MWRIKSWYQKRVDRKCGGKGNGHRMVNGYRVAMA